MAESSISINSIAWASTAVNGDGRSGRLTEGTTETGGAYTTRGPGLEAGLALSFPGVGGPNPPGWEADGDVPLGGVGSLLVSEHKSVIDRGERAAKARRGRCFHRVMSGLERGGDLRVMMLSGVAGADQVQRAWRSLVAWARKRGLLQDYIRVPELTDSWLVHLHIIWRGKFLDRVVLMAEWYRLLGGPEYMPGAKYVYLQRLHSKRGIAHYLAKYMAKGQFERAGNYSWSWGWVWKGFVRDWEELKRSWRYVNNALGWGMSYGRLLNQWRCFCANGCPP